MAVKYRYDYHYSELCIIYGGSESQYEKDKRERIASTTVERSEFSTREKKEAALRVIECPSCSTQFALPVESLLSDDSPENQENNPELHCSKCDELFLLSENALYESPSEFISALDHTPISQQENEEDNSSTQELDSSFQANLFSLFQTKSVITPVSPKETVFSAEVDILEETRQNIENVEDIETQSKVIDISVVDEQPEDTITSREIIYTDSSRTSFTFSPRTSTMLLASPIIGLLVLFFYLSGTLQNDGALTSTVRSMASGDLPEAPPHTLSLRDVSFTRYVLLDEGEVFSVNATLSNSGTTSSSRIQVEATLFNENGVPLTSNTITAGKPINTKNGFTSSEEVFALQKEYSTRDTSLSAEETKEVHIFFTLEEARNAKYYTMRIISVTS